MKVAFFNSHVLWSTHYETELEIIQRHLDLGDEVIQLVCNADLPACDINPHLEPEACFRCISKRTEGVKILDKAPVVQRFLSLTAEDKAAIAATQKEFATIADLQKLSIDDFEMGYAISSSIISMSRNPVPVLDPKMVRNYVIGTLGIYFSIINYLKKNKPDRVYVFNGRLAHTKAVLRACQKMNVECGIHERGSNKERFSVFMNTSIHDIRNTQREMVEMWETTDPTERQKVADDFYISRRSGKATNWYSFTAQQSEGLPEGFDPLKENIAIFNSSEDEFASLSGEWKSPVYENQLSGILQIMRDSEKFENVHIYLRMHPNLKNVRNKDTDLLKTLSSRNFTVILPEAEVSSYNLMAAASKVFTFGSSMGVEATYWGRPSVLAGVCFYRGTDVAYEPANHAEVMELIPKALAAKDKKGALIFGYYFSRFGEPYRYYKPSDFGSGTFRGVVIKANVGAYHRFITGMLDGRFPKLAERYRWKFRKRILQQYT